MNGLHFSLLLAISTAALQQTSIVFTGKVVAEAPLITDLPEGTQPVMVIVDQVMVVPPEINLAHGDHVTVAVSNASAFPAGTSDTFYTTGIVFGRTIAVREIAHETAPDGAAVAAKRTAIASDLAEAREELIVSGADAIIIGKVMSVSTPPVDDNEPVSEHDPEWRDAQVNVSEWMKGSGPQTITVRFPASDDVVWFDVPKLQAGTSEVLFLHKDNVSIDTVPKMKAPATFILLRPTDEEPVADAPLVRKAIAATASHQ